MRRRFCLMLFVLALPAAAQALEPVVAARGLDHPWGLAFLPDGRMLVTDRPGRMRIVERNGRLGEPLAGVPAVAASGQGGLLDVALHPKFAHNRLVYWSFSEPGHGGAGTAVARGRLEGNRLADVQDLSNHLGKLVRLEDDGRVPPTTLRRPRRRQARDLELRPPQHPGRRAAPGHRRPLDHRAWPAGRRRTQRLGGRQDPAARALKRRRPRATMRA